MYTIRSLCKKFGLSRSTLLYYDSIDLLKPSMRTAANYRLYSEEDLAKLDKICLYRKTGIPLEEIKQILISNPEPVLEKRLLALNDEMDKVHMQQKIVIEMLKGHDPSKAALGFDTKRFSAMLEAIGMSEEEMDQFHIRLEISAPDEHQSFLEFLGMPEDEISKLRKYYRETAHENV